jgi:hypothetical protein
MTRPSSAPNHFRWNGAMRPAPMSKADPRNVAILTVDTGTFGGRRGGARDAHVGVADSAADFSQSPTAGQGVANECVAAVMDGQYLKPGSVGIESGPAINRLHIRTRSRVDTHITRPHNLALRGCRDAGQRLKAFKIHCGLETAPLPDSIACIVRTCRHRGDAHPAGSPAASAPLVGACR